MKQGGLFKNLTTKGGKNVTKDLIQKASNPKKSRKTVIASQLGGTNAQQMNAIAKRVAVATDKAQELLEEIKKQQEGYTHELVTDPVRFSNYITTALRNGIISIDTEGSGLDPINDYACGLCLYTPDENPIYVPFKHTDFLGNVKEGQMPVEEVVKQVNRIANASWNKGLKVIYGNAKYDVRITKHTLEHYIKPYWDVILAGSFLNENELHGLKYLWDKYVYRKSTGNLKTFDKLFDKLGFNWFDWEKVFVYAANDALMTYQLYLFQKEFLHPEGKYVESQDLLDTSDLFLNIEMPLVYHVSVMEDTGVCIDTPYAEELAIKYNKKLVQVNGEIDQIVKKFDIGSLPKSVRDKLTTPINIGSPQQLGIILYDLLRLKNNNKDNPRGTGEEILEGLKGKYPEYKEFFEKILEYREYKKLLSTYIEKMPKLVKEKTRRLHAQFNQYGADTGRFSSKDPNLQNIPAKNKDIRPMFIAGEGMYLISGDFSQQEPRVLAHVSGDEEMIRAYVEGKDLYSWVASTVYNVSYEECLEFNPKTGEVQKLGKQRRQNMKSVLLGIMYGRGASAIAEQLNISKAEAQEIVDMFYNSFPKVKQYMDEQIAFCKKNGYVKTVYGRKRRLPDINLPMYEITDVNNNPLEDEMVVEHITYELENAMGNKKKAEIKKYWLSQGVKIKDNGGFIAAAHRQVLNSIIQGTSADITKKAMKELAEDEELNRLGFKMLLPVHDEIIGEGPKENALAIKYRMEEIMIKSCADRISVPMKVDCEITERWYGEDLTSKLAG